jgi:hypothetical protein
MQTKSDGNVVYADFRRPTLTIDITAKHEILYQDEHVALGRGTFQIGKHTFIVHALVERDA